MLLSPAPVWVPAPPAGWPPVSAAGGRWSGWLPGPGSATVGSPGSLPGGCGISAGSLRTVVPGWPSAPGSASPWRGLPVWPAELAGRGPGSCSWRWLRRAMLAGVGVAGWRRSRRSAVVVAPQMPSRVGSASAYARHRCWTGQPRQTALAASTCGPAAAVVSQARSGWSRHAAYCDCGGAVTDPGAGTADKRRPAVPGGRPTGALPSPCLLMGALRLVWSSRSASARIPVRPVAGGSAVAQARICHSLSAR